MLYNTHLDTLIRVAEAGSFRQAAEQMKISPSAVLKQISLLEKELGVRVFERSRKGVALTRAGESIYKDAIFVVQFCNDAVFRVREAAEKDIRPET